MSPSIRVSPHEQIVLILIDLDTGVEISALEETVKDELLVFGDGGIHALEDSWGFGLKIWVEFTKVSRHL